MDQQLAQTTIDDAISCQFNWTAELYFSDIENSNGDPIDLFHYTNKEIYKQQRSSHHLVSSLTETNTHRTRMV